MPRSIVPTLLFTFSAILFFSLGQFSRARARPRRARAIKSPPCARRSARSGASAAREISGTAGRSTETAVVGAMDDHSRAALVADIKQQLKSEMGLMPVSLMRERRQSFVELYSYDVTGASNYGTAGYVGNGYFITVKHAVIALGDNANARRITSVKIVYDGEQIPAKIVDTGDAQVEVDPGDWAILKVKEHVDLPALDVNMHYGFDFADSIVRLGNDYSKGIILVDRLRRAENVEQPGHLPDRRASRRLGRRRPQQRRRPRRHSDRPDAGRLPLLVHPAAALGDVPEGPGPELISSNGRCPRGGASER